MLIACSYVCTYLVTYIFVHACAGLYMQILIVRTDGHVLSMCVSIFPATYIHIQFQHMPVEVFALNMDLKLGID